MFAKKKKIRLLKFLKNGIIIIILLLWWHAKQGLKLFESLRMKNLGADLAENRPRWLQE